MFNVTAVWLILDTEDVGVDHTSGRYWGILLAYIVTRIASCRMPIIWMFRTFRKIRSVATLRTLLEDGIIRCLQHNGIGV